MNAIPVSVFESEGFQEEPWYQGCASEINIIPNHQGIYDFSELQQMEKSKKWVAEYKGDGNWNAIFKSGNNVSHYSRNMKRKYIDLGESWKQLPEGTLLVGEAMVGSQFAQRMQQKAGHQLLLIWDILYKDYMPVMNLPAVSRRKILEDVWGNMSPVSRDYIRIMPRLSSNFESEYIDQHEGLVMKPMDEGAYIGGGRKVVYWKKVKKSYESDAIILGYEKSAALSKMGNKLPATIVVGLYCKNTLKESLAEFSKWKNTKNYVGVGDLEDLKIPHTISKNGEILSLTPVCAPTCGDFELGEKVVKDFDKVQYKVLKINHFGQFESGSFRHPSPNGGIHAIRDDKEAKECTFTGVTYKLL